MQVQKRQARNAYRTGKRLPKGPNGGIQLLLIQSVDSLGKQGDVVEVKPGFARNYLIPQGLATYATDHHRRMVEKHKAQLAELQRKQLAALHDLADVIAKTTITIEANANADGHLYGSIGAEEIVHALKNEGISISTDHVRLDGPLKELAQYSVRIYLGQEIETSLKVWVVPQAHEN
ncbi:MAG: 50S ribosomal protein L9 [Thermoguttaceae bacterium]|nr:50S ribosomal protein L9 [Thermoguttaceae bacterium]